MINFKLKLLLPMVRSSDGQKEAENEGEIHSLGQAQMYGITMREGRKKPKPEGMFLNDHRLTKP